MSRSKRRRKDTTWCRGCDSAMVAQNGLGRCPECNGRLIDYKNKRQSKPPEKDCADGES